MRLDISDINIPFDEENDLEHSITITPEEWNAINANAVPENMVRNVFNNGRISQFKNYAHGRLDISNEEIAHSDEKSKTVEKDYMITTPDNPYNPWLDFDAWYNWDISVGHYHTCEHLARINVDNGEFSEAISDLLYKIAVDDLVSAYPFRYVKAYKPS